MAAPYASTLLSLLVVLAFAAPLAYLWHVEGRGRWRSVLTDRFLYGVPWGTLVVVAVVLGVYLFAQGGLRHWYDPLVVPFRAWSYGYPTGVLFSSLSHSSPSHLLGNLTGTIALAPLVEYAWGHYSPADATGEARPDGSGERASGAGDERVGALRSGLRSWLRRPWFRAVVAFPAAVFAVGLLTSLGFLGPVIGFSGVVFALGGAALVYYPIPTLLALLLSSALSTVRRALLEPIVVSGVSGSPPSLPWWAEIALQAHWLGVLLGVLVGLGLLAARDRRPAAGRIFLAALVYGFAQNLWAIPWIGSGQTYTLFRGPGVVVVVAFAAVVAGTAVARDRPVTEPLFGLPQVTGRRVAAAWVCLLAVGVAGVAVVAWLQSGAVVGPTVVALLGGLVFAMPATPALLPASLLDDPVTNRHALLAVLVLSAAVLAGPGAVTNLSTTGEDPVQGSGAVEVGDYVVTYEEDVRNRLVPVIPLPTLAEQTNLTTGGVVVVSEERSVWYVPSHASKPYVASEGNASVVLGGLGWRETIRAERTGWSVPGNDSAYAVDLVVDGERTRSFASDPIRTEPTVRGLNFTIAPTREGFVVRASRAGERVDEATVPGLGRTATLASLELRTVAREERTALVVAGDGTRVPIATEATYRNR